MKIATIFFGANDASDPELNPRHHVPLVSTVLCWQEAECILFFFYCTVVLLVSLAEAHNVLNEPVRFEINKAPIQGKPEDNCEGNTPSHRPPRQNNHYRPTSGSS